ncbi:MAG: hypothetical protein H7Z40_06645 [Phycisphaerae bacterium]|nr:hypothetical protein [Gemmatimonadaceae bacterium]
MLKKVGIVVLLLLLVVVGLPATKPDTFALHRETTISAVPSKVDIKLDFTAPFESHNITEFTIDSTAAGPHVTWSMHGPYQFISKVMAVFVSTEKLVGPDFEKGLASMQAAAEAP